MVRCELCDEFNRRHFEALKRATETWEANNSNEHHIWESETAENLALIEQAKEAGLQSERGIELLDQAAHAQSSVAAHILGWCYAYGDLVQRDVARGLSYYRRAVAGGSWLAMIQYAHLSAKAGDVEECIAILKQGVQAGSLPANYWLALHQYEREPSRETLHSVASVIEHAAAAGHPRARDWMIRLTIRGRLGAKRIPAGVRMMFQELREHWIRSEP